MDDRTRVLVTAVGGGGHGEQILKALRLGVLDYFIVGADANELCHQFQMCDENLILPLASDPKYLEALLACIKQYRIQAIFHGCEPELKLFSANRTQIESAGVMLPINPQDVISLCMNKKKTMAWLIENGFHAPRFSELNQVEQIKEIDYFPVIIKPSIGGGGSRDTFIAQTPEELRLLATYLVEYGESFLVQEYVGSYKEEYTVGVLHDLDGKFINAIAVKRYISGGLNIRSAVKNLTPRKELGDWLVISSGISHGYVGPFPEVTKDCIEIAKQLGVRGAVNIQCRYVEGKVYPFEINPRFSGTTSIRAMMGYNEPDLLIRKHLKGETIPVNFDYQSGVVMRGLTEYRMTNDR